jgi:predicted enzyme related to lactoylglutathione lyase
MLKVKEIAFFAFPVTDMARSRKFYEGILGLKVSMEHTTASGSAWVEYDLGGTTFALGQNPDWKPSKEGGSVAFEVENFDDAVAKLKDAHVDFYMEPFETPVCHMAIVRDPDDSPVLIHKRKPGHS